MSNARYLSNVTLGFGEVLFNQRFISLKERSENTSRVIAKGDYISEMGGVT
jgi:hypothetical protein